MKIGIDLDNVCVTTTQAVCDYINERLPVHITLEDITTYSIEAALPEQFKWIASSAFRDKLMWQKVQIIDDAVKYIEKLYNDGHEIYFVTSSLPENMRKKINHLSRNMHFLPKEYIEKHTINIQTKQLLDIDILIDDCIDQLKKPRWYISICLDYPWNRNYFEKSLYHCKNWEQIYERIKIIEKEMAK